MPGQRGALPPEDAFEGHHELHPGSKVQVFSSSVGSWVNGIIVEPLGDAKILLKEEDSRGCKHIIYESLRIQV